MHDSQPQRTFFLITKPCEDGEQKRDVSSVRLAASTPNGDSLAPMNNPEPIARHIPTTLKIGGFLAVAAAEAEAEMAALVALARALVVDMCDA